MTTYVHKYSKEDRLWTVGYFEPGGPEYNPKFVSLRDCTSSDEAASFINYLNGGPGGNFVFTP